MLIAVFRGFNFWLLHSIGNVRGRGARAAAAGQRRGDKKLKGAAKKEGGKNMPNKDVLMNY